VRLCVFRHAKWAKHAPERVPARSALRRWNLRKPVGGGSSTARRQKELNQLENGWLQTGEEQAKHSAATGVKWVTGPHRADSWPNEEEFCQVGRQLPTREEWKELDGGYKVASVHLWKSSIVKMNYRLQELDKLLAGWGKLRATVNESSFQWKQLQTTSSWSLAGCNWNSRNGKHLATRGRNFSSERGTPDTKNSTNWLLQAHAIFDSIYLAARLFSRQFQYLACRQSKEETKWNGRLSWICNRRLVYPVDGLTQRTRYPLRPGRWVNSGDRSN